MKILKIVMVEEYQRGYNDGLIKALNCMKNGGYETLTMIVNLHNDIANTECVINPKNAPELISDFIKRMFEYIPAIDLKFHNSNDDTENKSESGIFDSNNVYKPIQFPKFK